MKWCLKSARSWHHKKKFFTYKIKVSKSFLKLSQQKDWLMLKKFLLPAEDDSLQLLLGQTTSQQTLRSTEATKIKSLILLANTLLWRVMLAT